MSKTELVLPIGNWQNKSETERIEDFSSALLELERRPNLYWITIDQLENLKKGTRTDTPHFQSEYLALESEINWAINRPEKYAAWISPQLEGVYPSARIILSKKYNDGEKVRILNVAICLALDKPATISLANIFSQYSSCNNKCLDTEKFRAAPIYFDLPKNIEFANIVEILSREKIEDIFERKIKAKSDAEQMLKPHQDKISNENSLFGQILIGASLEQQALSQGYLLNKFRDCPGILNTEALRQFGAFDSMFNFLTTNPDRYSYNDTGECKKCKEIKKVASVKDGGCGVCRDCQIKFDLGIFS